MSPNETIIEKIKKLLRMKRGGTSAEVETALSLARELAQKHGIDMATINPDEETIKISQEDAFKSSRLQWECKYAMMVCQEFFNISGVIRSTRCLNGRNFLGTDFHITFIGTAWDIQIATYVFRFLTGHFRRQWNHHSGRLRNRQAFLYGMYMGLCAKLEEQRQRNVVDSAALMCIDQGIERRRQFMEKQYPNLKDQSAIPDGDAKAAKFHGYIAGRKTEIRSGVGSSSASAPGLNQNGQMTMLLT